MQYIIILCIYHTVHRKPSLLLSFEYKITNLSHCLHSCNSLKKEKQNSNIIPGAYNFKALIHSKIQMTRNFGVKLVYPIHEVWAGCGGRWHIPYNLNTWETEVGGLWVSIQVGLHRKTLSQKKTNNDYNFRIPCTLNTKSLYCTRHRKM